MKRKFLTKDNNFAAPMKYLLYHLIVDFTLSEVDFCGWLPTEGKEVIY